mgnify:CR=1 FL=1
MWLQLGPYRINLTYVERYLPVKDEEGTKIELRFASGRIQEVPVPEEEAERVLDDLDRLTEPMMAESEVVVRWGANTEAE